MIKKMHEKWTQSGVKLVGVVLILAMLAGIAVLTATAAGPYGDWLIDGNVPDTGAIQFVDGYGKDSELGPVNSNETKLGVIHAAAVPMLGYTNPNGQVDFRRVWLGTGIDEADDVWLYFAWERDSSKGSGVIMFEFHRSEPPAVCDYDGDEADLIASCNPWANRAPEDFIIVWQQVGKKIVLSLREWGYVDTDGDGEWGGHATETLVLGPSVDLDSSVSDAAYSPDGFFGEAVVNLSATVFEDDVCESIGNVIAGTLTGNSDTADFKDTVFIDARDYLSISNCGTLKVVKNLINNDGGTLSCEDFYHSVDSGTPVSFESDCTNTYIDLFEGNYSVVETPVAGYTTTYAVSNSEATDCNAVYVPAGGTATCTITNSDIAPTLKLVKVVNNNYGGTNVATDWTLTATSDAGRNYSHPGNHTTFETVYANADYLLGETGPATPSVPYVAGLWTCDSDVTVSAEGRINLPLGKTGVICTITNNDQIAVPTGATTMSWQIKDTLTITGIRTGAGGTAATVSFYLYSDDTCSTLVGSSGGHQITNGEAESEWISVVPGTYYWKAVYSGDAYNMGFTTRCGYEVTTIGETITEPWKAE